MNTPRPTKTIPDLTEARQELFWKKVDKTPGLGPNGDCWLWKAGMTGGYGCFGFALTPNNTQTFLAHRIAFFLATGKQPGEAACHSCDTPACVNPEHIIDANIIFNNADREAKGRGGQAKRCGANNGRYTMPERTCRGDTWRAANPPEVCRARADAIKEFHQSNPGEFRGEGNPNSKLTDDAVREIRSAYATEGVSSLKLAAKYGVSKQVVLSVIHRHSWAHVI